jgi:hypothetical protein
MRLKIYDRDLKFFSRVKPDINFQNHKFANNKEIINCGRQAKFVISHLNRYTTIADDTFAFAYPIRESHRSVLERNGQGNCRLPGTERMAASKRSEDRFAGATLRFAVYRTIGVGRM